MSRLSFSVFAISAFVFFSCGNDVEKTIPDTTPTASVSEYINGEVLYSEKCTMCHGADGKQNTLGAADLSTSSLNHETVVAIITSGKNGMRAFSPELSPAQIEAVAVYVESLRK